MNITAASNIKKEEAREIADEFKQLPDRSWGIKISHSYNHGQKV